MRPAMVGSSSCGVMPRADFGPGTVDSGAAPCHGREHMAVDSAVRLAGEDLPFWWSDAPMPPTTLAMLLLLDRALAWPVRRPGMRGVVGR